MSDNAQSTSPERLAPSSPEAEEAVLGSCLINPDEIFIIEDFLMVEDFYIVRNGWVWDAMLTVFHRGHAVDNLTVIEELRNRDQLDSIGGVSYITFLINNTPTHIHAETYGRIVERASIRRKLLNAAQRIGQVAMEESTEIEDVKQAARHHLDLALDRDTETDDFEFMNSAMGSYAQQVEELSKSPDSLPGLSTGFRDINRTTGGLQKTDLVIVAARPGVGKTSYALSIVANVCKEYAADEPLIAFFSMEMSKAQLVQRIASGETNIDSQKLKVGKLDDREWQRFHEAEQYVRQWRIALNDTPAHAIESIQRKTRNLERKHGPISLIVVDYLQLSKSTNKTENRNLEISMISSGLKAMAKEMNCPVLALAQLNRGVEGRADKRPALSDLRDSGAVEQDADIVQFIYRDDMYNENSERPNQADIITAKNRNGPTGVDTLYFRKEVTTFANMEKSNINLATF